jgi:hypothetical protein
MERITPTEKYYNYFDREENPKFEVSVSLQIYLDNDPVLADQIAEKESVTLGLLGSATHRNPQNLVEFLKKLRPNNHARDKIVIEEISDTAIDIHQKKFEPDTEIPVFMTKMDMTEMGIKPKSFDVLISDFTVNFLSSIEDVGHFFKEIEKSIKDDGVALVTLSCNRNYADKDKYGYDQGRLHSNCLKLFSVYKGSEVKQLMFTLPQYIKIAENNGLDVQILYRKDNKKRGPQFFLKIQKHLKKSK